MTADPFVVVMVALLPVWFILGAIAGSIRGRNR